MGMVGRYGRSTGWIHGVYVRFLWIEISAMGHGEGSRLVELIVAVRMEGRSGFGFWFRLCRYCMFGCACVCIVKMHLRMFR